MMLLFQVFLSVVITLSLIQIRKNPFRNNSRRAGPKNGKSKKFSTKLS
jgi:hypothetical protein